MAIVSPAQEAAFFDLSRLIGEQNHLARVRAAAIKLGRYDMPYVYINRTLRANETREVEAAALKAYRFGLRVRARIQNRARFVPRLRRLIRSGGRRLLNAA